MNIRLLMMSLLAITLVAGCSTSHKNGKRHRVAKVERHFSQAFLVNETHLAKFRVGENEFLNDVYGMDDIIAWVRVNMDKRSVTADLWIGSVTLLHQPTGFAMTFPVYDVSCAKERNEEGAWRRTDNAEEYCRPNNLNMRGNMFYTLYRVKSEKLSELFRKVRAAGKARTNHRALRVKAEADKDIVVPPLETMPGYMSPAAIAADYKTYFDSIAGLAADDTSPKMMDAWRKFRVGVPGEKAVVDRWNEVAIYKPSIYAKLGSGSYNGEINKLVINMVNHLGNRAKVAYLTVH